MGKIKKGSIRPTRKKIWGIGTFDYDGLYTDKEIKVCYYVWKDMLRRTTKAFQEKHKSYVGVSVCDEWLSFNNFKTWFDKNYKPNFALDKDVLSPTDNKIYSPDTCCFIPQELNKAISKRVTKRTGLPNGVCLTPNHRYAVRLLIGVKNSYLGTFDNIDDARRTYKTAKENYIHDLALQYYKIGFINDKVYNVLSHWTLPA